MRIFLTVCLLWTPSSCCRTQGDFADCSNLGLQTVPRLPRHIRRADLSLNNISEVNQSSLLGLEQLEMLDMGSQKSKRVRVKGGAFKTLSNLTYLHLGGNEELVLEPEAFVGLENLQHLILLYNSLNESILEERYLQPLLSLQMLDLAFNQIARLRPAAFFRNMTRLSSIKLKLNSVGMTCEQDLQPLHGKHFELLQLSSNRMFQNLPNSFDWEQCGNPFRDMSVEVLDMSQNSLDADRAQLFFKAIAGTHIQHLIFSSQIIGRSFGFNNIKDPDAETFEGLGRSSLRTLDVSLNFIFSLEPSVFAALQDLEEINLFKNKINQIQRGAFLGLTHLQKLNLSRNLIGEIYDYTFHGLSSATVIDLSYNHIGVLMHMSFSSLDSLQILNLTGNALTQLHSFGPLPALQRIYLHDNKLDSAYGLSLFAHGAVVVDMSSNALRNLGELYSILAQIPTVMRISLSQNLLSVCYPHAEIPAQNSLLVLELDNNALQAIWEVEACHDVFDLLRNLIYLVLRNNLLRVLPSGIFGALTSLQILDLSFNMLTHLPQNIFPENLKHLDLSKNILSSPDPSAFFMLSQINLGMNRFLCDCSLKEFILWLNQTNVTFLSPRETLTCEYPKELLGVPLVILSTDECEADDESFLSNLRLSLFLACTASLTWFILCTITYVHFRGKCFTVYKVLVSRILEGHQKVPSLGGLKYDAYLCFSNNDFGWVEKALLEKLDSQFSDCNRLRCCFEMRDFLPGEDHISSIRDAVWGSRKTVCIMSREFLRDGWCIEAFKMAQSRTLEEIRDVLVVVVVGHIPHYRLMKYEPIRAFIQKKEYLQWPEDSQDVEWFYHKLTAKIMKESRARKGEDTELQSIG